MNVYTYRFSAKCPNNDASIEYTLLISTEKVIMVEEIVEKCALLTIGFHEHIADALIDWFGGEQTITAEHHGVKIETHRKRENSQRASNLNDTLTNPERYPRQW